MRIVLITGHQYPNGTALTNRIRSYLEPLTTFGNEVIAIIYKPTEDCHKIMNTREGKLNGVSFINSAFSIVKKKNFIAARISWVYSYLNCIKIIYQLNKLKHIEVIIQASSRSSLIPIVFLFSRINRVKYLLENSEFPWFILSNPGRGKVLYKFLYLNIYYQLFDGFLAMTRALVSYHCKHSKASAKVFHLPMTVDINRFSMTNERENYITYIGNVSFNKDGVQILLNAFISIADKFPGWKLMIIGDTSRDTDIIDLSKEFGLEQRIILKGAVHRDDVPVLLCKSKILALARPRNLQSEGGFPTKLGEYLATGNLVVITKVGEIPEYLQHGISALMAEPDSVDSFAKQLAYGIEHYDDLGDVRKAGYSVCLSNFDARLQARRLNDFLLELISNGSYDEENQH